MPALSKLKLVIVWEMAIPETEPGRAGHLHPTLACRVQDNWGHRWVWRFSPPLIDLRHMCLMPRGTLESVWSAELPPAGSRLSSVCCNRKSFCDSGERRRHLGQGRNGWAPHTDSILIGGQGMLPYLRCLWSEAFCSRLLFHADCLEPDSENKTSRPKREAAGKEEPHRFISLQTNMAPSFRA